MKEKKLIICIVALSICFISFGQSNTSPGKSTGRNSRALTDLEFVDIGPVAKRGVATINPSEIIAKATGADIWGKHDEFLFGYKKLNGDFDISVQISSLTPAHKYTKAGIMARTDLSDSSQHVFFQVFPDNSPRNKNNGGCEFQYRSGRGQDMKAIYPDIKTAGDKFNVNFPDTWIKLIRKGDVFESYISIDNVNWNLYSSFTIKMPNKLYVGLALTSHNKNEYTNSTFRSFQLKR
jgi:hypothetical protein